MVKESNKDKENDKEISQNTKRKKEQLSEHPMLWTNIDPMKRRNSKEEGKEEVTHKVHGLQLKRNTKNR